MCGNPVLSSFSLSRNAGVRGPEEGGGGQGSAGERSLSQGEGGAGEPRPDLREDQAEG